MPLMKDVDDIYMDPKDVDIVEAFAAFAATCTPDQLQESEDALALVARAVGRKEARETPEAEVACAKEWERLEDSG